MSSATSVILVTLVAYKLLLIGVGVWASRRVASEGDFFLAGARGLGAWTAGLSYAASTSSAWVLLGFTGFVFTQGLVALWLVPGIFGGYVLTWLVMGPRLNAETRERGHLTVVDFLTTDAGRWARAIGLVAAAMILFCFVFYISSQFQAAGNALAEVFGLSATEAVLIGAVVIVLYCLLGGFLAASVTDALQAVVMMGACVVVPLAAVGAAGGAGAVFAALATDVSAYRSATGGAAGMLGLGLALGLLGTGLGALGQPQLLNRIMAVRSPGERLRGALITIGWGVVVYSGLVMLALAARALSLDTGGEALFFAAAQAFLPPVVAGLVVAAVLSAVMSTVDSLLLAAASAVSHDSGLRWATRSRALLMGRLSMVGVALFAVGLTLFAPKDIFTRVLFSWVALGAAFGPALLARCLGLRVRGGAVLLAVVSGFTLAVAAYSVDGTAADVVEKWGSWALGGLILFAGRERLTERRASPLQPGDQDP